MTKYWFREHEYSSKPRRRVWLDGWASDTFEILSHEDFIRLDQAVEMLNQTTKKLSLGTPIALLEWTKED